MLLNPRRTRTNMKLLQLVSIFLLPLCGGQSAVTTMQVKEDDDAVLKCSFGTTNMENGAFDWKKDVGPNKKEVFFYSQGTYYGHGQTGQDPQFEGRVFHFPHQLQFGNVSIKIKKAKTSDSGTYSCYSISPRPQIRSSISLTVDPILKPRPGAAPEHYVTNLDQTQTSALLQCVVRGASPKPEVNWTDSDGKVLPADDQKVTKTEGNKYDTVLSITVTKTDNYTCVATQKEIHSQNNRTIFVHLNGAASEPSVTNLGDTKDGVLLQCVVRGASPELKVFWKDKDGNLVPSKEPQKTDKGGSYDIILQTTVTKTDYYRCVTTEGKIDDEIYSETHVVVPGEPSNNSISGVVGLVVGPIGIIAAVVFGVMYLRNRNNQRFTGSTKDRRAAEEDGMLPT